MTSTLADPSPPSAHPPAAATAAAAAGPDLQALTADARAWCLRLVTRHLDPGGRLAVASASKACRLCVLEAAQKVTFALLSYSGMGEAAWQKRLAAAEADLCARGRSSDGRRSTKLLLHFPTHNTAALLSALGLSPAAREAVTELELRERENGEAQSADLHTAWLRVMPAAFPTLHTLRLDHMCGRLPSPALLPHLRVLHVVLRDRQPQDNHAAKCASIGPYLPQLTILSVWEGMHGYPSIKWASILTSAAPALTHFSTNSSKSHQYIPLLLKHAPQLQHLTGCVCVTSSNLSGDSWAVKSISLKHGDLDLGGAALLPQSPHAVTLCAAEPARTLRLEAHLDGRQGLSTAVQQRMQQWQFQTSCYVCLYLPNTMSVSDLRVGLVAALRQLSGVLPAGSTIACSLTDDHTWPTLYPVACEAITAAGPSLTHITVLPPAAETTDDQVMATVVQQQPPVQHAALTTLRVSWAHAHVPWPWQSLHVVDGDMDMGQLLQLPDPRGGQYEVHVRDLTMWPSEWTHEMYAELKRRLQHWTFVVGHMGLSFTMYPGQQLPSADQPKALRKALQALRGIRWRCEAACGRVEVSVPFWTLTSALVSELHALPTFTGQAVTLSLSQSHWVAGGQYESLPSTVPACYSTWELLAFQGLTAQHVIAICRGARARGQQFGKLTVLVKHDRRFTDEQRSQVEACIDQEGLGRWVSVEWDHLGLDLPAE